MGIARGIYRDASLLIADEPTAALDAKAEARVFAGLQHASTATHGRRTTILVTHRQANIKTRTEFWFWRKACSSSKAPTTSHSTQAACITNFSRSRRGLIAQRTTSGGWTPEEALHQTGAWSTAARRPQCAS
jgi:ABC-type sugar transport system ATPase subunit